MLGLDAHGRGHAANQGWLPPVLGLRQVHKRPKHPKTCCCLLTACKAQLLKEPGEVSGSGQDGVSGIHQVNIDSEFSLY